MSIYSINVTTILGLGLAIACQGDRDELVVTRRDVRPRGLDFPGGHLSALRLLTLATPVSIYSINITTILGSSRRPGRSIPRCRS
ncbi:MAG TPA: hypothetical protein VLM11_06570 [Streptosporangiaceae bacterium]|nr:hypothetical protein [Streptosporangiaceae bacterium]